MDMVVFSRIDCGKTINAVTHIINEARIRSSEHHLRARDHIPIDLTADLDKQILHCAVIQRCR